MTVAESRVAELVEILIGRRAAARSARDFALADRIRDRLREAGVMLEDRAGGTVWRFKGHRG